MMFSRRSADGAIAQLWPEFQYISEGENVGAPSPPRVPRTSGRWSRFRRQSFARLLPRRTRRRARREGRYEDGDRPKLTRYWNVIDTDNANRVSDWQKRRVIDSTRLYRHNERLRRATARLDPSTSPIWCTGGRTLMSAVWPSGMLARW